MAARPSTSARLRATSSCCRRRTASWRACRAPTRICRNPIPGPSRACVWRTCCSSRTISRSMPMSRISSRSAKLVVVRLLGGVRYWPYGIEQVSAECRKRGIALACLPGDDQPDPQLSDHNTLPPAAAHRLWQFLVQGGLENASEFLRLWRELDRSRDRMAGAAAAAACRTLLAGQGHAVARRSARGMDGRRAGRRHRVLSRAGASGADRADRCADLGAAGARHQSDANLRGRPQGTGGRRSDRPLLCRREAGHHAQLHRLRDLAARRGAGRDAVRCGRCAGAASGAEQRHARGVARRARTASARATSRCRWRCPRSTAAS